MEYDVISTHFQEASQKYLKLLSPAPADNGNYIIRGAIDVIDDEGFCWDTYEVEIVIQPSFPHSLPLLIETSNKIKREQDWHINPNGTCCLAPESMIYAKLHGKVTLVKWLDQFAHPFLANHIYRVKTGHYASIEYSHGVLGIIEAYCSLYNLQKKSEVIMHLRLLTGKYIKRRNESCFCGSKKKYKKCYLIKPETHTHGVPQELLKKDLVLIEKEVNN